VTSSDSASVIFSEADARGGPKGLSIVCKYEAVGHFEMKICKVDNISLKGNKKRTCVKPT